MAMTDEEVTRKLGAILIKKTFPKAKPVDVTAAVRDIAAERRRHGHVSASSADKISKKYARRLQLKTTGASRSLRG
jgi:hypothetical protein